MGVERARFHGIVNGLKRILLLTMHILLLNYTNFKTLGQFENLVFVITSTRENIRLIARSSLVSTSDFNVKLLRSFKWHFLKI